MGNTSGIYNSLAIAKEVGVIGGSDFYSTYNSSTQHGREFLETKIRETKRGVYVDDVIKHAHPTLSHLKIYELNCGLPIVLPFDKEKGTLTSSGKLVSNSSFKDAIDIRKIESIVDPGYTAVHVFGDRWISRRRLIGHLNKGITPLNGVTGWFSDKPLGNYVLKSIRDEHGVYHTSAGIESDDYSEFAYHIGIEITGNDILRAKVKEFVIEYFIIAKGKTIDLTISLEYDENKREYDKRAHRVTGINGFGTFVYFNNEGKIYNPHSECYDKERIKNIKISKKTLQLVSSEMEDNQRRSIGMIAALETLNIDSLDQRIDYASSIQSVIKAALQSGEEVEQFKLLVFK